MPTFYTPEEMNGLMDRFWPQIEVLAPAGYNEEKHLTAGTNSCGQNQDEEGNALGMYVRVMTEECKTKLLSALQNLPAESPLKAFWNNTASEVLVEDTNYEVQLEDDNGVSPSLSRELGQISAALGFMPVVPIIPNFG